MSSQLTEPSVQRGSVLGWCEFMCWTALLLMPFLRWVNGPPVSDDQGAVRGALVVAAVSGAVVLRIVNWRRSAGKRTRGGVEKPIR